MRRIDGFAQQIPNQSLRAAIGGQDMKKRLGFVFGSCMLVLGCSSAPAEQPAADRVAPAEPGYRVYVTSEVSGEMNIIDPGTLEVVSTVMLGKRPRGIHASPDGKLIYVALSGSPIAGPGVDESKLPPADKTADGIGVVDIASLKLLRILRGVSDPEQLVVSRDGTHLYIASEDTGTAVVVEIATGKTVATLPVGGEPEGVGISPDGRFVYMTSEEDHSTSVIDTKTNTVIRQFEVGQRPR